MSAKGIKAVLIASSVGAGHKLSVVRTISDGVLVFSNVFLLEKSLCGNFHRRIYKQVSVHGFVGFGVVFVHCLLRILLRFIFITCFQGSLFKADLFLLRHVPND